MNDLDTSTFVQTKVLENFAPIFKSNQSWNFRCPICHDSKKSQRKRRGHYYPATNSYYCWNCGYAANGIRFIADALQKSVSEVKREFLSSNMNAIKEKKLFSVPVEKKKTEYKLIEIPDHWKEIDPFHFPEAWKYLKDRKILDAPFAPSHWTFYFNEHNKRIVIPWMIRGEMKYFQQRSFQNDPNEAKYLFPPDLDKPIFGLDELNNTVPHLYLNEGCFDSIFVKNGLAIGSVFMTDNQEKILDIRYKPFSKVYLFDNQWEDETSRERTRKIAKENPNMKMFIWPKGCPYKDVNEYVEKSNSNPFDDLSFLLSRTFNGARAYIELSSF